jgi:hypothetical protein
VQRLQNVKNQLAPNNNSKVVAFLWHQGESNMTRAVSSDTYINSYKSALKDSLTGMRTDIMRIFNNNNSNYTYPILLGGLSYDKQFNRITGAAIPNEYRREMSQRISELSNPSDIYFIPKSAFVSSDSLTVGGFNRRLEGNSVMDASGNIVGYDDNNHFSATSARELGKRYYFYYNQIK